MAKQEEHTFKLVGYFRGCRYTATMIVHPKKCCSIEQVENHFDSLTGSVVKEMKENPPADDFDYYKDPCE